MCMQSKLKLAIKEAYYRGYRVNEECMLITPNNRMRKLCIGKEGYPLFNIRINGKCQTIPAHRLCAFQKYGEISFAYDCIRHLDGNKLNFSLDNIELGTFSENQFDKPKSERIRAATIASHSYSMKWDKEHVEKIKSFYASSKSYKETMKRFNILSKSGLHYILHNR